MLPEVFLVILLFAGTPQQQIGLLERTPTATQCTPKANALQEFAPEGVHFGCITFTQPTII